MSIVYPLNRQEVVDRVSTDIQAELPESEPFLRNSYLRALAIGYAGGLYDAYKTIQELQKQLFPDTATGEFADRWASYKGIYRNPATQSDGYVTITGIAGTVVPLGTQLNSSNGISFVTQTDITIQLQTISIFSLTRSGTTVTATLPTGSEHNYADGITVTISGANETDYNGTFPIVVTSASTFTYEITGSPTTPATGIIFSALTFASILVKSIDYGISTNFPSGSELFFDSVIAGVDASAFVQYSGLTGGEDLESDDEFKKRYLYSYQHPISYFNVAEITTKCEEINGVTRVFVHEITPDVGQVTIYFMRDNDVNPIPSGSQVAIVKNKLMEIKPAHVDPDDVIVKAPTPKSIHFKFSVLDPNTDTMRAAIVESLKAFFAEVPTVGQALSRASYSSAIYYTVDPETGNFVNNFVLAYPIADIPIADGEIATFPGYLD